ncbi:unnamed protein product [Linum tenue]|uniref:S-protein homolog n=1 Tax=Linum tenue TaxID=586396 RepID=A0AAV0L4J4_9ROSI|nr:unnamed protein product [Linum tenue]
MALILHCKSGDDDLRGRAVEANATYEFTFGMTLDTLFWCKAAFRDRRLSFVAFGQVNVKHFDVSDGGVDGVDAYSGDRVHVCDWN